MASFATTLFTWGAIKGPRYGGKMPEFGKKPQVLRVNFLALYWSGLYSLVLSDVVLSYFGRTLGIVPLQKPYLVISGLFFFGTIVSVWDIIRVPKWIWISFGALFLSLAIGAISIPSPISVIPIAGFDKVRFVDLLSITVAFFVGYLWVARQESDGVRAANLMLVVGGLHTIVVVIALLKLSPEIFPVIDSVRMANGLEVNRPEVTTDQTRQVLYLFVILSVFLVRSRLWAHLVSLVLSVGIGFILLNVQARAGTAIFGLFFVLAMLIALHSNTISLIRVGLFASIIGFAVLIGFSSLIELARPLVERVEALDDTYGGRITALQYLFEKLADPDYWLPQGIVEYLGRFGNAPHSFPTMVYLSGGVVGLISYLILFFGPIYILGLRIWRRVSSPIERLAFLCGTFALSMELTQPVITHEIFWLWAGVTAGAAARSPAPVPSTISTAKQQGSVKDRPKSIAPSRTVD